MSTQLYRWIPASEFKFQENTLYFAENRMPGTELYKIAVEYVSRMSVNGKEFLKNGKELFWKHLNDWEHLYIMEEIPTPSRESAEEVLKEIDEYLGHETFEKGKPVLLNSIGGGSILHKKVKQALSQMNQSLPLSKKEVENGVEEIFKVTEKTHLSNDIIKTIQANLPPGMETDDLIALNCIIPAMIQYADDYHARQTPQSLPVSKENEWFSIENDGLPRKDNEEYIVYAPGKPITTLDFVGGKWHSDVLDTEINGITHWMPLPKKP